MKDNKDKKIDLYIQNIYKKMALLLILTLRKMVLKRC